MRGRSIEKVDQPWYCELCNANRAYTHDCDMDSGLVKEGVLEQHRRISPQCTADDVPPIRFREREKGKPGSGVQSIMD
jgi:hypothetical protein